MSGRRLGAFFFEPDLFDIIVPLDNTIPIYLIYLLWKLGLALGLDLQLHYFCIVAENNENDQPIFRELFLIGLPQQLAKINTSSLITTHSARNLLVPNICSL